MPTLKNLIVTASEQDGSRYTFAALELPTGQCVVPGESTSDCWYPSRDEIEANGMASVESIEETGEPADWSDEDIAASLRQSVREFGREAIPESLRAMAATDSRTCGASPTGWNVYRTQGDDETQQALVGSAPTQDEARRLARPGDQIQQGLDGEVVCP